MKTVHFDGERTVTTAFGCRNTRMPCIRLTVSREGARLCAECSARSGAWVTSGHRRGVAQLCYTYEFLQHCQLFGRRREPLAGGPQDAVDHSVLQRGFCTEVLVPVEIELHLQHSQPNFSSANSCLQFKHD